MDKHTKKTPSLFQYPVLVAFGLFFIGLFVLDMATPDRAYSELENTTLTQPAERGGDHPLPKDPERRHPAGPGTHDVRPALQHPEK